MHMIYIYTLHIIAFHISSQLSSMYVKPEANILWTSDGQKKARSRSTTVDSLEFSFGSLACSFKRDLEVIKFGILEYSNYVILS